MTELEYKNSLLNINKHGIFLGNTEIMNAKEKPFIKQQARDLCEKYKPESVLEIGYGMGYTAEEFKKYAKKHVVVEPHPVLAQQARDNGYVVIEDFIQNIILSEEFDLIYDDRCELVFEGNKDFLNNIKHKHYEELNICKSCFHQHM